MLIGVKPVLKRGLKEIANLFGGKERGDVWTTFWILQVLFFIFYSRLIQRFSTMFQRILITFADKEEMSNEKIKSNGVESFDNGGIQGLREDSFDCCA